MPAFHDQVKIWFRGPCFPDWCLGVIRLSASYADLRRQSKQTAYVKVRTRMNQNKTLTTVIECEDNAVYHWRHHLVTSNLTSSILRDQFSLFPPSISFSKQNNPFLTKNWFILNIGCNLLTDEVEDSSFEKICAKDSNVDHLLQCLVLLEVKDPYQWNHCLGEH